MGELIPANMRDAARKWWDAGVSIIRVKLDGTKAPLGDWKQYQTERADRRTVEDWFADNHPGLGIVCGAVSGHLEMLEFEGRAVTEQIVAEFGKACAATGIGDLWIALSSGFAVMSPSGGLHLFYRVAEGVAGNTKLAEREARDEEYTRDEVERAAEVLATRNQVWRPRRVLIETRGQGGFVVGAPSHGATHPTGKAWQVINPASAPGDIMTITADERDALHAAARTFDAMPHEAPDWKPPLQPVGGAGLTPGEDFNLRGTWDEVLEPHGWKRVYAQAGKTYWRRPGKNIGISAVTGGDTGDYFYAWTSSTDLPIQTAMQKWRVYAYLDHGGDFSAAAAQLRRNGYGADRPAPSRVGDGQKPLTPLPGGQRLLGAAGSGGPGGSDSSIPNIGPGGAARARQRAPQGYDREATDNARAVELIERFGEDVRYSAERNRWLTWQGQSWTWCYGDSGPVREMIKQLAEEAEPQDARKYQHIHSRKGTSDVLASASSINSINVLMNELDADPQKVNTPNGIIDAEAAMVYPHDPKHLMTKITKCAADPTADKTAWLNFLAQTFKGNEELIGYMQRLCGYSLLGRVELNILPFLYGLGANGKTVFLETVMGVLGDYATTAPANFLMASKYGEHSTEIARLAGARMVVCGEVDESDRFDEQKVKMLTGGESITARFMRQDYFTFTPSHTLWLAGNHRPTVSSGGTSFWRRLRLVPFLNTVPEAQRIPDLQRRFIEDHGPAILDWIMQGAIIYTKMGLMEPPIVTEGTKEYARDQDTIGRFVEDRCLLGRDAKITTKALQEAYMAWCTGEGETPVNPKRLSMDLRSRFDVGIIRSHGQKIYAGVGLANQW